MGAREFDVLVALCRAAPSVTSLAHAERLLSQLTPYLSDSHIQTFRSSPLLKGLHPSPWEVLTKELTSAVLAIASNHPSLRQSALESISAAVDAYCEHGKSIEDPDTSLSSNGPILSEKTADIAFIASFLGFLDALAARPETCTITEAASILFRLQKMLSEQFMVAIEATLSSIRNAHGPDVRESRRLLRQYAAHGRSLGAMLLQHALMRYVAAATASMLAFPASAQSKNILDRLSRQKEIAPLEPGLVDDSTLEALADLIAASMSLLEADADYLQIGSAWQQKLAFATKADSLVSYLFCSLVNEDIADADVLASWLEGVLADPVQLADDTLASVTLRCMSVLAKTSPPFASALARSLPKLVVQGRMTSDTADIAADTLASILQLVPQDLVISTLYSLGNVLSSGPSGTKNNMSVFFDGNASMHGSTKSSYGKIGATSTLSLVTNDADETVLVHGAVVGAIVAIARECNDDKITALALSMLVQKFSRANVLVDAKIIVGAAAVGLRGGPNELKPLLKFYAKIGTESLLQENTILLKAVCVISEIAGALTNRSTGHGRSHVPCQEYYSEPSSLRNLPHTLAGWYSEHS